MKKTLKTEDVLTVATGIMLGDDMHSVMDHLFPGITFGNGYAFVAQRAAGELSKQFPAIQKLSKLEDYTHYQEWLEKAKTKLGDTLEVEGPVVS